MKNSVFSLFIWVALSIWALFTTVPSATAQQTTGYTSQVNQVFGEKLTFSLTGMPSQAVQQVQLDRHA